MIARNSGGCLCNDKIDKFNENGRLTRSKANNSLDLADLTDRFSVNLFSFSSVYAEAERFFRSLIDLFAV
jgi:hypothetical protein